MAENTPLEDAMETGRLGPEPLIERDAFTLQGQGKETAKREREAREQIRRDSLDQSHHDDEGGTSSTSEQPPDADATASATTTRRRTSTTQSTETPSS